MINARQRECLGGRHGAMAVMHGGLDGGNGGDWLAAGSADRAISPVTGEFLDRQLEGDYRLAAWPEESRQVRAGLLIGAVAFGLAGLTDYMRLGWSDSLAYLAGGRLACIALILGTVWLTYQPFGQRWTGAALVAAATALAAANAIILTFGDITWAGLMPTLLAQMIFVAVLIPTSMRLTLANLTVLVGGHVAYGMAEGFSPDASRLMIVLLAVVVVGVEINRRSHRTTRQRYASEQRLRHSKQELELVVGDLESERDLFEQSASETVSLMEEIHLLREEADKKSMFLTAVLDTISQGVCVYDRNLKLAAWNATYKELLGMPNHLLVEGTPIEDIIRFNAQRGEYGDGATDDLVREKLAMIQSPQGVSPHTYERQRIDGRVVWVDGNPMPDGGLVISYSDITERKRAEETIRRMAMTDPLTGLANRNAFNRQLEEAIKLSRRSADLTGLALLDLDGFKTVNDTYGHPVGDALLIRVAAILKATVREVDTVARLGGDEFAIIFRTLTDPAAVDMPAKRIIDRISAPLHVDGHDIRISVSIGIGYIGTTGLTDEELLKKVDSALYRAKEDGKNRFVKAAA